MICDIVLVQAQSDCVTNLAIEKFISQINDNTMQSKNIYFCTKFLSNNISKCFPHKVGNYRCKYFSGNIDEYCRKNKVDFLLGSVERADITMRKPIFKFPLFSMFCTAALITRRHLLLITAPPILVDTVNP